MFWVFLSKAAFGLFRGSVAEYADLKFPILKLLLFFPSVFIYLFI